jgi:hypothetical protein
MILRPGVAGPGFSLWLGTLEYTGLNPWEVWKTLLGVGGLLFVSLSVEEGVDLEYAQMDVEHFPWDHDALVAAAVRQQNGTWRIAAGAEYEYFAQLPGAPELNSFR